MQILKKQMPESPGMFDDIWTNASYSPMITPRSWCGSDLETTDMPPKVAKVANVANLETADLLPMLPMKHVTLSIADSEQEQLLNMYDALPSETSAPPCKLSWRESLRASFNGRYPQCPTECFFDDAESQVVFFLFHVWLMLCMCRVLKSLQGCRLNCVESCQDTVAQISMARTTTTFQGTVSKLEGQECQCQETSCL